MRFILTILLLLAAFPVSYAQEALPTIQEVEVLIKTISDSDADAAEKEATVSVYRQVIEVMKRRNALIAAEKDFTQQIGSIPTELPLVKQELANSEAVEAPVEKEGDTLQSIEAKANLAKEQADIAKAKVDELDAAAAKRVSRVAALPELIGKAKATVAELETEVSATSALDATATTAEKAERLLLLAKLEEAKYSEDALTEEQKLLQQDSELRTAERDIAIRKLAQEKTKRDGWQRLADGKRRLDAEETERQAMDDAAKLELPALVEIAQEYLKLTRLRTGNEGLSARTRQANLDLAVVKEERARVERQRSNASSRVKLAEQIGLTNNESMGNLLRGQRESLPIAQELAATLESEFQKITEAQIKLLELDEDSRQRGDVASALAKLATQFESLSDAEREKAEKTANW